MRKYAVEVREYKYSEFEVEAVDRDAALEQANDMFYDYVRDDMDSDGPEFDVYDLGEVELDG